MEPFKEYPNNSEKTQVFIKELIKRPADESSFEYALVQFLKLFKKDEVKDFITSTESENVHDYKPGIYEFTDLGDGLVLPRYLIGCRYDLQWLDQNMQMSHNKILNEKQFTLIRLSDSNNSYGIKYLLQDTLSILQFDKDSILYQLQKLLIKFTKNDFDDFFEKIENYTFKAVIKEELSEVEVEKYDNYWINAGWTTYAMSKADFGKMFFMPCLNIEASSALTTRVNKFFKKYSDVMKWEDDTPTKFRINLKHLYLITKKDPNYEGFEKCLKDIENYKIPARSY